MRLGMLLLVFVCLFACKKSDSEPDTDNTALMLNAIQVNGVNSGYNYSNVNTNPTISLKFSTAIDKTSASAGIQLKDQTNTNLPLQIEYSNGDKDLSIKPQTSLKSLEEYRIEILQSLKATNGKFLSPPIEVKLVTAIDSTDKFPRISQDELLTKVQQQTFKYFWDFAHPTSGMIRERNTSGDIVTTGGTGFGVMAIVVGVERGFITRAQGAERVSKIADFLLNNTTKVKGAFSHWVNGATGAIQPFSAKDDGADIVETSLLMQGLLVARNYFKNADATETQLREDITTIWEGIQWNFFTKGTNQMYWHYSENHGWDINLAVRGWNECLITYVLAKASPTYPITKEVYDNGWTANGTFVSNKTFYGYNLPLGTDYGGPLFFAHYSFLGIDPRDLTDGYTNYFTQNKNHSLINYQHSVRNPNNHAGYSDAIWGLTASDIPNGYTASSPTNDKGVIAPTAAISSIVYTPTESLKALEFFYYKLGDKLWKEYGFVDAFSIKDRWFANSHIAIDQGPIIIMIENYRSSLIWENFMSIPEVKTALNSLGFNSPKL